MDNSFNEFYRYNCVLHDYQEENDELKKEIEELKEGNNFKEAYEFNCQELTRVTSELVDCKCELDCCKDTIEKLRKAIENLQKDNELKEAKINRLESINNIHVKSLKMAIEIIRNGNY